MFRWGTRAGKMLPGCVSVGVAGGGPRLGAEDSPVESKEPGELCCLGLGS